MKKFKNFMSGKGYYIALILCAAAIGISGYLYYRNTVDPDPQLQRPTGGAAVVDPNGDHVDVMGTEPGGNSDPTSSTKSCTCSPVSLDSSTTASQSPS